MLRLLRPQPQPRLLQRARLPRRARCLRWRWRILRLRRARSTAPWRCRVLGSGRTTSCREIPCPLLAALLRDGPFRRVFRRPRGLPRRRRRHRPPALRHLVQRQVRGHGLPERFRRVRLRRPGRWLRGHRSRRYGDRPGRGPSPPRRGARSARRDLLRPEVWLLLASRSRRSAAGCRTRFDQRRPGLSHRHRLPVRSLGHPRTRLLPRPGRLPRRECWPPQAGGGRWASPQYAACWASSPGRPDSRRSPGPRLPPWPGPFRFRLRPTRPGG